MPQQCPLPVADDIKRRQATRVLDYAWPFPVSVIEGRKGSVRNLQKPQEAPRKAEALPSPLYKHPAAPWPQIQPPPRVDLGAIPSNLGDQRKKR